MGYTNHGDSYYRIVASQGMPAKYLYFPEENHWVLGVQNGIVWQREFKMWLDRWFKQ